MATLSQSITELQRTLNNERRQNADLQRLLERENKINNELRNRVQELEMIAIRNGHTLPNVPRILKEPPPTPNTPTFCCSQCKGTAFAPSRKQPSICIRCERTKPQ